MSHFPLYLTVAEKLRRRISEGYWRPGDRLPSEESLARELYVSRVTLREALRVLERDGLISRRHGVGIYLLRRPVHITADVNRLEPFASEIHRMGIRTTEEVLLLEPATLPPEVSDGFRLDPDTPAYRLEVIRRMEGVPVIFTRDYVLAEYVDPELYWRLGRNILEYLIEAGRPTIDYCHMTIKAALPDDQLQVVLDCDRLEPLIRLDSLAYTSDHRPITATCLMIRSKHYEMSFLRHRWGGAQSDEQVWRNRSNQGGHMS